MQKICIVSIFYNNEDILDLYEKNFEILNNNIYDVYFNLVCNYSNDDTLNKLFDFINKYDKINVFETKTNGCSVARNMGINNCSSDTQYIIFLDSDFVISFDDMKILIDHLTINIKYVGYYGGKLDNKNYIGGNFINDDEVINSVDDKKYIGGGFSATDYNFLIQYNIRYDEYYDPFVISDVDFSFQILKYSNIKKITPSEKIIHLSSKTIKPMGNSIYGFQLEKNTIYFINKFNINYCDIISKIANINYRSFQRLKCKYKNNHNHNKFKSFELNNLFSQNNKINILTVYNNLFVSNELFNIIDDIVNLCSKDYLIIDNIFYTKYKSYFVNYINHNNIILLLSINDINDINNDINDINNDINIVTYNNFTKLLLDNLFKSVETNFMPIEILDMNKLYNNNLNYLDNMPKNNIKYFLTFANKYIYDTIEIFKIFNNYKLIIINPDNFEILTTDNIEIYTLFNEFLNLPRNFSIDYYIDLNYDYIYIQYCLANNIKIITTNIYPNCELIKPTINGYLIEISSFAIKNKILKDFTINKSNYENIIYNIFN